MKMNYVDTSKLDVCEHLENSFKIILDDYLTFNFNFIKNDKFDDCLLYTSDAADE